jgi:hypothetical protein
MFTGISPSKDPRPPAARRIRLLFALLALLVVSLACQFVSGPDQPPAPPGPEATVSVETAIPEPAAVPTTAVPPTGAPTSTLDPLAACPQPADGASLYLSRQGGFCFLSPTGYTLEEEPDAEGVTVRMYGPPRGEGFERPSASLVVKLNGPDEGKNTEAYARRWLELNVMGQQAFTIWPLDLNGVQAVEVNKLPGFLLQKGAFLVANGYRYSLMLSPDPAGMQPGDELANDASAIWDTVTDSIAFFPPETPPAYVSAEQVCPQPGDGTSLLIVYTKGYCTLYPQDFTAIADFEGRFEGGPVLGDFQGFENVITSLTIGYAGPAGVEQARDLAARMVEEGTTTWEDVQEVAINGYPAVVVELDQDPWVHRIGLILVGDRQYSLVANPVEPEMWPDGIPYLEKVWSTVTGSIQFFTPWE